MNELALFAGAGGGILGGMLLGWKTVCAVEIDPYCRSVLCQRQNDGILPAFPIWDDVRDFDGKPWRGIVDVVSGGFPCQDTSCAGKGAGLSEKRSGLWWEMRRIIGEVRPRYVFVENSPALIVRGLRDVLGSLAELGYDARWGIVSAADAGAPHLRKRIWIMAKQSGIVADTVSSGLQGGGKKPHGKNRRDSGRELEPGNWWATEPGVGRVVNGMAFRVDRIKAIGNGQVPQAMALAWRLLMGDQNQ